MSEEHTKKIEEQTKKICKRLHEAIADESGAQTMYGDLLKEWKDYLPVEDTLAREVILAVLKQEGTHEAMLKAIGFMKCPIERE